MSNELKINNILSLAIYYNIDNKAVGYSISVIFIQ